MSLWLIFWIGDLIVQLKAFFCIFAIATGAVGFAEWATNMSDAAWGKVSPEKKNLASWALILFFIFTVMALLAPSDRTVAVAQAEYIAQMPAPKKIIARAANWLDASFLPEREK